ncbi:MAG: hypothetical protein VKP63_07425 [Cyanobacteriota bacterium]|nr:hypothetical protein [Cyanobacteriota bacterium]
MERLQGWHLPLLQDPAFQSLLPRLQRALLLAVPERLLGPMVPSLPPRPVVHVAVLRRPSTPPQPLGLIVTRRLNRRGTCWEVDHLALAQARPAFAPSEAEVVEALVREAIQTTSGVASWIATASILDGQRQAFLRAQGFQQVRLDQLWRWDPKGEAPALSPGLQQCRLNRQTASLMWHLEQSCCPAHLRHVFDRRIEDLLDQSRGNGWLLVDHVRNEAVASIRHQIHHPEVGEVAELSLQPGRTDLYGDPCAWLLHRLATPGTPLVLRVDREDGPRRDWLQSMGATLLGEQMLMARTVWRRQEAQPARQAALRLEAMLDQWKPSPRTLPTPVGQR